MCHYDVNIMYPILIAVNYNLKMRNNVILSLHIFFKNDQALKLKLTHLVVCVSNACKFHC